MHHIPPFVGCLPTDYIGLAQGWQDHLEHADLFAIAFDPNHLRKHCLINGSSGSGKTVLLQSMIQADLARGHSIVVIDARGDFKDITEELAARHTHPRLVRIFDLRNADRPFGFNPLHGSGEAYHRALGVLSAVSEAASSWGITIEEHLRSALLILSKSGEPITRLEPLFYHPGFLGSCMRRCGDPELVAFWERYLAMSEEKRYAQASAVMNKVSMLFAVPSVVNILGHQSPVNLRKHLDTPGSVTLASLAVDQSHASGRMFGRILLSSVVREVFARVEVSESRRNPVRLYIDECQNLPLPELELILSEGRRYGISLVAAHQSTVQLSPTMRRMFFSNASTRAFFRAGREDSRILSQDVFGSPSAFDFTTLGVGEAVLWRAGDDPMVIEVNPPVIEDVGRVSQARREFLQRVFSFAPRYEAPGPLPAPPQPEAQEEIASAKSARQYKPRLTPEPQREPGTPLVRLRPASLEEWL